MIREIKEQIYKILSEDLGYITTDNPYTPNDEITYPFVRLSMSNTTRDMFKNMFQYKVVYKIDIFSDYDGEAEILEMEEAIFNAMPALYNNENVTYVRESSFRIMDDKSTGVLRKHGILMYTILSTGGFTVEDEPEEDNPETESGS